VNLVKNNETQQLKGNPRSFYGQIRRDDLDPLFMTNKNLGIRKTPQTVMELPFDKSRGTAREIPISSSSSSKNQSE
jgi:hypothetical protein